jgi:hypothetical protein
MEDRKKAVGWMTLNRELEISRQKNADKETMNKSRIMDSFLKGLGVLFGFVQTPSYSGRN